jgi:lysozyme family protein
LLAGNTAVFRAGMVWPRESSELDAFYGDPRGPGGTAPSPAWEVANLTDVDVPWQMHYGATPVTRIRIHRKCAESLARILAAIWDHYGRGQGQIVAVNLDKFGGSYNFRPNRNNAAKLSVHSYGAALDLAPDQNANGKPWQPGMMPIAVVKIFAAEGWAWGGQFGGTKDCMHFQATLNPHAAEALPGETTAASVVPAGSPTDLRHRMAKVILDEEARRDKAGHLAVYPLPAGDGGGSYEVAGINDRYHKNDADKLVAMIHAGQFDQAEVYAIDFMAQFTDVAAGYAPGKGADVEFYLRDCAFNRGPTGAVHILQIAVGVESDGVLGHLTRAAVAEMSTAQLLDALRPARETYERSPPPGPNRDESSPFWKGLVNRWNKALVAARAFSAETPQPQPKVKPVVTTAHPLPTIPFDQIEAMLETVEKFLPFANAFLPQQVKDLEAYLPFIELNLKAASIVQANADPVARSKALAVAYRAAADKLDPPAVAGADPGNIPGARG